MFSGSSLTPLKRPRESISAMDTGMGRITAEVVHSVDGEHGRIELSTASPLSSQAEQALTELGAQDRLAPESLLAGTFGPSSGRAYLLLQSTLFTWCPSLAPVAADMAAATEDQSISIVDRSGNPLITDDSRAVAVHGLGASTRVVVVLETGDVLLRDMLAGHGGGAYKVPLERDKDERVTASTVGPVDDDSRKGFWVVAGTSQGRVFRLGPLSAQVATVAPGIVLLGGGTGRSFFNIGLWSKAEEAVDKDIVSIVLDGSERVVALGKREAVAYPLVPNSATIQKKDLPTLQTYQVTLGGAVISPGVVLRLVHTPTTGGLALHAIDYSGAAEPVAVVHEIEGMVNAEGCRARLHVSPANTPASELLAFVLVPSRDALKAVVLRAKLPLSIQPGELEAERVDLPSNVLGPMLGAGFLHYTDTLLLLTSLSGGLMLRLDAPRRLATSTGGLDPSQDMARVGRLKAEMNSMLALEGKRDAAAVRGELERLLVKERVVGLDAALCEAVRQMVMEIVDRRQSAGRYWTGGTGGGSREAGGQDTTVLVQHFLSQKKDEAWARLQAFERLGLLALLSDVQRTVVTEGLVQLAAMLKLCTLLSDMLGPRSPESQCVKNALIQALQDGAREERSPQREMPDVDLFLTWPSKITARLRVLQATQEAPSLQTSERVEVVFAVSLILQEVLEQAREEGVRLSNDLHFRRDPRHTWLAGQRPTLDLMEKQLTFLLDVRRYQKRQQQQHEDVGDAVRGGPISLARIWLKSLGSAASPAQKRHAVATVYEYEAPGKAHESLRLARDYDAQDVLAELEYLEGNLTQLQDDIASSPDMARHLFMWLYQNNKLKDMLELGASSPEAQRELELVLDVDKNARRLAWINQINARKYRDSAKTLLELESDEAGSLPLRCLWYSLGCLSVEASTTSSVQQMEDSDDAQPNFMAIKCELYEDGTLLAGQRLLEAVRGKPFPRVLGAREVVNEILDSVNKPETYAARGELLLDLKISLLRTAMDIIDRLQGRRQLVWGDQGPEGDQVIVSLWHKAVTNDWNDVWSLGGAAPFEKGRQTIFYRLVRDYSIGRRIPRDYDYPRLSEPTDSIIEGVLRLLVQTQKHAGDMPPTLRQVLLQHRNTAQQEA